MTAAVDEEALIAHVIRVKCASGESLTAAQVHAALTVEGLEVAAKDVKKACSKAAKRLDPSMQDAAVVEAAAAPSKQQLKAAKVAADSLKAAEAAMMNSQKALRDRWMFDGVGGAPPSDSKGFIELATARAISGTLAPEEVLSKERVEADVCTLAWILTPGSPFKLPNEQCEGARAQLERLESLRGLASRAFSAAASFAGARAGFVYKLDERGLGYYHEGWFADVKRCYQPAAVALASQLTETDTAVEISDPVLGSAVALNDNASLDRLMAKAGILDVAAAAGGAMDEMD